MAKQKCKCKLHSLVAIRGKLVAYVIVIEDDAKRFFPGEYLRTSEVINHTIDGFMSSIETLNTIYVYEELV